MDDHIDGMRMVGAIESELKNHMGSLSRIAERVPSATHLLSNIEQGGHGWRKRVRLVTGTLPWQLAKAVTALRRAPVL